MVASFWLALSDSQAQDPARTIAEFLKAGGATMIPIGLCSVIVLAFTLERVIRLRRARVFPDAVGEAVALVEQGRAADAVKLADAIDAPAARVLAAALRRRGAPLEDVERAMEDQAQREYERMRANVRPITLMAHVSPLLGLFGTVIGIIDTFHQVALVGLGKPERLAEGMELALVTTLAGLAVAIPALICAAWCNGKARRAVLRIRDALASVPDRVKKEPEGAHAA